MFQSSLLQFQQSLIFHGPTSNLTGFQTSKTQRLRPQNKQLKSETSNCSATQRLTLDQTKAAPRDRGQPSSSRLQAIPSPPKLQSSGGHQPSEPSHDAAAATAAWKIIPDLSSLVGGFNVETSSQPSIWHQGKSKKCLKPTSSKFGEVRESLPKDGENVKMHRHIWACAGHHCVRVYGLACTCTSCDAGQIESI